MAKKRNRRERRERRGGGQPRGAPIMSGPELRELEGRRDDDAGEAAFPADRVVDLGEISDTNIYEGELETGLDDDAQDDDIESLELLTERELLSGETDDAYEASQEGLTYVPPISPPTWSEDAQGEESASDLGVSLLDEPDGDDDALAGRVRAALRADSGTAAYANSIEITVGGGRVVLRGLVGDLADADDLVAVASDVAGVADVVDQLTVRGHA